MSEGLEDDREDRRLVLRRDGQVGRFLRRWCGTLPGDLCGVILETAFMVLMLIVVGAGLGVFPVLGAMHWWLVYAYGPLSHWLFVFGVLLVILVAAGGTLGASLAIARRLDDGPRRPPGAIRTALRGWKERYCPLVRWVAEDLR